MSGYNPFPSCRCIGAHTGQHDAGCPLASGGPTLPAAMTCFVGDTRDGLRQFAADGIRAQTCITSPPYWGLRDYGMSGQLGLESTPAEYVANMVEVFRLVRDVLADDGTLWLNIGDSYNTGTTAASRPSKTADVGGWTTRSGDAAGALRVDFPGLKTKDLCGIPWRLAFALQADGWYLRSDIIWHKPNPMPESVTDRPTKAHEYLFLLAKQERYFYDAEAIAEKASDNVPWSQSSNGGGKIAATRGDGCSVSLGVAAFRSKKSDPWMTYAHPYRVRNRRTVWTIATEPYSEAHFATFPTALVQPCILAGSRPGDVVLDPFMGSGTVAQVAQDLGRQWIGCELNPDYVSLQSKRAAQTGLVFA